MAYAEASVLIERPVGEVFPLVLNGENHRFWRPTVQEIIQKTPGPIGVGTVFSQGIKGPNGQLVTADYKVIACEVNRQVVIQVLNGPYLATGTFSFEPQGDATRVTFSMEESSGSTDPGKTAHLQNVVKAIANLKEYLEAK